MRVARRLWALVTRPEVYWRLFSLLLAVILWLLAAGDGSLGEAERTVTLPVEVQNLPADLVLLESPEPVKVRIRGLSPPPEQGRKFPFRCDRPRRSAGGHQKRIM